MRKHESKLKELSADLTQEIAKKEQSLTLLNDTILQKNADIASLERSQGVLVKTVDDLKTEESALRLNLNGLSSQISELVPKKEELELEVSKIQASKETLEAEFQQFIDTSIDGRVEKEKEIARLNNSLLILQQDIEIARKTIESESSQLAKRKKELDDREEVLNRRTYKVEMDENKLRRNVNLLDL